MFIYRSIVPLQTTYQHIKTSSKGNLKEAKTFSSLINPFPLQDVQIGEIGETVDRLGAIALEIGQKADKQAELVAGLNKQAEMANEDVIKVNNAIKDLIVRERAGKGWKL